MEREGTRRFRRRTPGPQPVGGPFAQNPDLPQSNRNADIAYYVILFLLVVAILVLVILLTVWVCKLVLWTNEQQMVLDPHCDDGNVCTLDFSKQEACMSFPINCQQESELLLTRGVGRGMSKRHECVAIPCHDRCYDDAPQVRNASPKNHLAARSTSPNGVCSAGACQASYDCKGQCTPTTTTTILLRTPAPGEAKKAGINAQQLALPGRNAEQCEAEGCPHLEFAQGFSPTCTCSACHVCEYIVYVDLGLQHSDGTTPFICSDTDTLKAKCMAAVSDEEYLKSCLVPQVEQCVGIVEKRRSAPIDRSTGIGPRNVFQEAYIACKFTFGCAKPVVQPFLF